MQLTLSQMKQAVGDIYLDNWMVMQMNAGLAERVRELESKVAELTAAKPPEPTPEQAVESIPVAEY